MKGDSAHQDPIFDGAEKYGNCPDCHADMGMKMFEHDVKPGKQQTKVNMDKSHGKPSGKIHIDSDD